MHSQPDWQTYEDWNTEWRERPPIVSPYSVSLLIVFVGAFLFLVIMALERPWADSGPAPLDVPDARTFADRGLEPGPPAQPDAAAAEAQP